MAISASVTATTNSTVDQTVYTFSGQSIGDADSSRIVIACIQSRGSNGQIINSVTIAGITATKLAGAETGPTGSGNSNNIYAAEVPSGTTADIVVTFATAQLRALVQVVRVVGSTLDGIQTSTSNLTPLSMTLNVGAGGLVVSSAVTASTATSSWTGITKINDYTQAEGFLTSSVAHEVYPSADASKNIQCSWSVPNAAYSAAVALVADNPIPINTIAPVVSGTATVGQTLSCTTGTWDDQNNGSLTYTYQWTRSSNNSGSGETNISGATSSTYSLQIGDLSRYIRCRVTATNNGGGTNANSNFTNSIASNGLLGDYEDALSLFGSKLTLSGVGIGPTPWLPTAKVYNGTSDFDTIATSIDWRAGDWSVAAWLWATDEATDRAWIGGTSGDLVFRRRPTVIDIALGNFTRGVNAIRDISVAQFPNASWRLITVTHQSNGLTRVYSGSTLIASATLTNLSSLADSVVIIGRRNFGGGSEFWDGRIAWAGVSDIAVTSDTLEALLTGPLPINTTIPTLNSQGTWTVGTWNSQLNGDLTYTVILNKDGSPIATLQEDLETTTGSAYYIMQDNGPGQYTISVTASNNAGSNPAQTTTSAPTTYRGTRYPLLVTPRTSYIEINKEFISDEAGIAFEANGILQKKAIQIAAYSWQSRTDIDLKERSRNTEYLQDRFKSKRKKTL